MPGQFFEHGSDIGVEGRGETLEAAFEEAARAMFSITTDSSAVQPRVKVAVSFEEEDEEIALVSWLNALLAEARVNGLALGCFRIARQGTRWSGEAWGEPWRDGIERGVEVKGATFTMLSVKRDEDEWVARCVVDV
jgi:SHS2 domain-containing protein